MSSKRDCAADALFVAGEAVYEEVGSIDYDAGESTKKLRKAVDRLWKAADKYDSIVSAEKAKEKA